VRVRANAFVSELIAKELLEARVPARLSAAFASWLEDEIRRVPTGDELEEWFEEHDNLCDLFAGGDELERSAQRHFGPAFADAPVIEAHNPDLERAIAEPPDSPEPYLVYSDWLQERGDPMGELIALGAAAHDAPSQRAAFDRLLERRRAALFGELAPHIPSHVRLDWFCGLVREIRASIELPGRLWGPLWDLRVNRVAQAFEVSMPSTERYAHDAMMTAFAERAPATVRRVILDQVQGVDATALLRPGLQHLELVGRGPGSRARLPHELPASVETLLLHVSVPNVAPGAARWSVRTLGLDTTGAAGELIRSVELPNLQQLTLRVESTPPDLLAPVGGANWGPEAGVQEVLDALHTPPPGLHQLVLRGELGGLLMLRAVSTRPLVPQIDELALPALGLGDRDITQLSELLSRFSGLRSLDVTGNELSSGALTRLRSLVPTVIDRGQLPTGTLADRRLRRFAGSRLIPARELVDSHRWLYTGREDHFAFARYRGTEDYELWVRDDLTNFGCTCPSSYQPCKHVVALALMVESRHVSPGQSAGVVARVGSARAGR